MIEALVVDYGGVLTNSVAETMSAWFAADGVDGAAFGLAMRELLGVQAQQQAAVNPVHALERGEIEIPDFERQLAEHLVSTTGAPVRAEGLLQSSPGRSGCESRSPRSTGSAPAGWACLLSPASSLMTLLPT